jgi:RHS repeat-associated protein
METKVSQLFNNVTSTVSKYYTYDHMGRLLKMEQQIAGDGNGKVTLASMDYNELGQLIRKDLHSTSTALPLQSVDYQYNIRGWLTQINSPDNLGTDLFAMRLRYNDTETGLNNTSQFNGNITGMVWNSTGKAKQGYAFAYDAINRLTISDYKTNNGSAWTESTAYEEKGITYDNNGNIGTLQRSNSEGTISDNYTYSYTGNQLMNISSGSTYTYDKNGNMTFDGLRGLYLTYNILNLPETITKGTDNLSYIYSATGEKLAKLKNSMFQQYYTGNMVYNSSKVLDYILHEEGMVKKATAYTYEYYLKDHLGNTRVVFSPNGTGTTLHLVAEYYPFGLSYRPISPDNGNKYLYNGKELQDETLGGTIFGLYDYGARMYDPQIGRWNVPDPLAEYRLSLTPYNYCRNNPILYIDLFGLHDTIRLAEVSIVASRNPPNQSSLSWLWILSNRIDYFLLGNTYDIKVRNSTKYHDWMIRNVDQQMLEEIAKVNSKHLTDPALHNYVRSNESYQGTEDKEIQKKAANNIELINNAPKIIRILKLIDSIAIKAGILNKDDNGNFNYFDKDRNMRSTKNPNDTLDWTVIRSYELYKLHNGDTVKM